MEKYKINKLIAADGYVYCKTKKGMHVLNQAARITYDALVKNLKTEGYSPDKYCPNIWVHESDNCCLCMIFFGMQCLNKDNADHLIQTLQKNYKIIIDQTGAIFCGLNIYWNYNKSWFNIAMIDYVITIIQKLQHTFPVELQLAPHQQTELIYIQK